MPAVEKINRKPTYLILSIDGGGLRGIVPTLILEEIERITNQKIFDIFDFFAGTSTGGLIITGLTYSQNKITPQYNIQHLKNIYLNRGDEIFPDLGPLRNWFRDNRSLLCHSKFNESGLEAIINELFGAERLTACLKPVLIPTYNIENDQPIFFKTRYCDPRSFGFSRLKNPKLFDICRATSAGPTYLPSHQFIYCDESGTQPTSVTCIDGGVFLNNPTLAALVEIWKHRSDIHYNVVPAIQEQDIYVLSLGTGHYYKNLSKGKQIDEGALWWARNLVDIMIWGPNNSTDFMAKETLTFGQKVNYLRLNVTIADEEYSDMADSRKLTTEYLTKETYSQIINNSSERDCIRSFLNNAGVI